MTLVGLRGADGSVGGLRSGAEQTISVPRSRGAIDHA